MVFELLILLSISLRGSASISEAELACLQQERSPIENPHQKVLRVTAYHPAYLHCKVPSDTTHMVAWTRGSDQALLTAGTFTFSADPRFQISKRSDTDWVLIIRRSEPADTGCYLCEVNTHPTSVVMPIYLHVNELVVQPTQIKPAAKLMSNMEGSEVILNCTVRLIGEEKESDINEEDSVLWTRDGHTILFNDTHKYVLKSKRASGTIVHEMRIKDASKDDDGQYSCTVRDQTSSQIVHVNSRTAAFSSESTAPCYSGTSVAFFLFLVLYRLI